MGWIDICDDCRIIQYQNMSMRPIWAVLLTITLLTCTNTYFLGDLIQKLNGYTKSWKSGLNTKFMDMSLQQTMQLMGTKLPIDPQSRIPQKQSNTVLKDIPQHFDSRQFWPKCQSIKEVRDQSTCGSCWAFAAVQAMSDRLCIAAGQRLQTRISSRHVLSCCGAITCGKGCEGGNPHGAWKYFKDSGIVSEKCQPYPFPPCDHHTTGKYEPCGKIQATPKCQTKCQVAQLDIKTDLHFAKLIYSIPSRVSDIQTQILTNGPVQASFNVYQDFLTYKSGVYHHITGTSLGGHSVKIIGWGVQENVPYWLVVNSWNQDWGDKGLFKIKRGVNQCGIQKEVLAGIPVVKGQGMREYVLEQLEQ